MAGEKINVADFEKAKRRLDFMRRAAALRGIQATKIEPQEDGGIDHFVEGVSPYLELYWSLETGGEDRVAAEFCLWYLDNPDHAHSYCFYLTYSGAYDTWEFGYERDPESVHESPKAKTLAEQAFGFKEPGSREVSESAALSLINALCAGFASTLPKAKSEP